MQVVGLVATIATGVITLLVGIIVNRNGKTIEKIEADIEICVSDTKDCNKSIASLAIKAAVTDERSERMDTHLNTLSERTHQLVQDVTELRVLGKFVRGSD